MTQTMLPEEQQYQAQEYREQFSVQGDNLVDMVKGLVHEGNVRRLIVKQNGHVVVEIPVTWGVLGTLLSPSLAALAAIGLMVSDCTVEVIRDEESNCPKD